MNVPNLTIKVEPAEASSVVYGALAAKTSNDSSNSELLLIATITNNELSGVSLTQVTVSFVPPSVSPSLFTPNLMILSTQTERWSGTIILPVQAPSAVKLSLSCNGFSDANVDMPLAQYASPVTGGGYSFPAKTDDLKQGEYWIGRSGAHEFAYDLFVVAYDAMTNSWLEWPPGSGVYPANNGSYHIWGKPIYAMADGVVRQFKDGIPANTPPDFPSPVPGLVYEGNHFYIQHGADLALYAHFQAGTLNPALTSVPTGTPVVKGQFLGLAGNSGNSSRPHLHIHVNRTTIPWGGPPRPLPFSNIYVLDLSAVDPDTWPPNSNTSWNAVSAQALPNVVSAIWPGPLRLGKKIFGKEIFGKKIFWRRFYVLAWVWIIIIGGLMITPGGIDCIVCGPALTWAIGLVSIVLGALGFVSRAVADRAAARQRVALPQVDVKGDMHG